MAGKNDRSWEIRLRMYEVMKAGKTEQEAFDSIFPTKDAGGKRINKRGSEELRNWKAQGLWPISEEELRTHALAPEPCHSEHTERSDQSSQSIDASPSEAGDASAWEHRVKQIAREVCEEMIQNVRAELNELASGLPTAATVPSRGDEFPEPTATGRKENRVYGKLGVTLDAVLLNKLAAEAKREKVSIGKLLDLILWQRYGHPLLSYQLPDEDRKPLEAQFPKTRKK